MDGAGAVEVLAGAGEGAVALGAGGADTTGSGATGCGAAGEQAKAATPSIAEQVNETRAREENRCIIDANSTRFDPLRQREGRAEVRLSLSP